MCSSKFLREKEKRGKCFLYKNLFCLVILYPLNGCFQNRRFAVEKSSLVATKSERARRFRDGRAFSGIAAAAAPREKGWAAWTEWRWAYEQETKHTDDRDGNQRKKGERGGRELTRAAGGAKRGRVQRRKKRNTREEARRGRQTLHNERQRRAPENQASTRAACTGAETREKREEPEEPLLVPASSQTNGPSPDAEESRTFCAARSSLHLRTDPLTRCHRTLRFARSSASRCAGRLVCRCTAVASSPRRHAGDYRDSRSCYSRPI